MIRILCALMLFQPLVCVSSRADENVEWIFLARELKGQKYMCVIESRLILEENTKITVLSFLELVQNFFLPVCEPAFDAPAFS